MSNLIPQDLKRCQAEKPNGHNFMTLGGRPGLERCSETPTWIATESAPGPDGLTGAMSLCDECKAVMVKQMGDSFAVFAGIERAAQEQSHEHDSPRVD